MNTPLKLTVGVDAPARGSLAATPSTDVRGARADGARRALNAAAASWFVVAVCGQFIFFVYIVAFFGRAAVRGQFASWNEVLAHGYIPGDTLGNLVVSLHLAFAALITAGGTVQLISGVRRLFPTFHRWNGRAYLVLAVAQGVGGLIMVWTRGTIGDLSQSIAISINALLIILCAGMTLRHALARRTDVHRRWALRLFLVVSGVWFFRIGLMFWIVVNQGPVGFDPHTFTGPALTTLAFAQYLLPLAVLQLYFRAHKSTAPGVRITTAMGLAALTLMTAAGTAAATMIMWLPHLK